MMLSNVSNTPFFESIKVWEETSETLTTEFLTKK